MIFITREENGQIENQGLCIRCAQEMGLKPINGLMEQMGITPENLEAMSQDLMESMEEQSLFDEEPQEEESRKTSTFPFAGLFGGGHDKGRNEESRKPQGGSTALTKEKAPQRSKRKHLNSYCIDVTARAREGKIDRVIGRKDEIERVIRILNRRQKNNPCLIGEPGVGKTAIAEGLAMKIVEGDVPHKLRGKEVFMLDLTALVAGTQFRGQFESRMKGLIDEVKKEGKIILVIDEVHSIVGAGDSEGSMNAANILKPALSRGEVQVIGATTFAEYRKYIEKDAALERRFQPVTVDEPSIEDSIEIIYGIRDYYEKHHCVAVSYEIARQAVLLSERYIPDRFLPDKAIDLLDEACSEVNLSNKQIEICEQKKSQLQEVITAIDACDLDGTEDKYREHADLKSLECRLLDEIKTLEDTKPNLTVLNLSRIIELWTKIPASKIYEAEFKRVNELEDRLKEHVVGQDKAVAAIARAIRRNRAGISAKRKPVSFIFAGSTGVGKTELVKQLALDMFAAPDALIRLDMSEYMEKHAVSKLIGSPPGYVGYDEAGQLTEKIRRRPYSVILFDEIEKAHPDALNILLQVLDDGTLTDAQGRKVSFENTIIVMTTNAGSEKGGTGTVGFGNSENEQSKARVMKSLTDFLRPEFLNRVDDVICFNILTEDNFKEIAKIMLLELTNNMDARGIKLTYTSDVLDYLTEKAYSRTYGARNLRRQIERDIEDLIAMKIIEGYDKAITAMHISVSDGTVQLTCA